MPIDLTVQLLLSKIKVEADRLLCLEPTLSRLECFSAAIDLVIMQAAEAQAVTPFEARIITEIDRIQRNQGGRPVSTIQLSMAMRANDEPMNRFTLHHHLSKLEDRGLLCRPSGPKSGWGIAA